MAAAWISVIGSAVTAIAAFGGVVLAQRATRMRDLDSRVWESRSGPTKTSWGGSWQPVMPQTPRPRSAMRAGGRLGFGDQVRALLPTPDLEARVTAYASADILRGFRQCLRLLTSPSRRRDAAGIWRGLRASWETT